MTKILIIPDAHAKPGVSNERFKWLGNFIVDELPDHIVNIGDFFDGPSLSLYDVGKKSFHGRTYKQDVDSVIDAQEKLFRPINDFNVKQRLNKKKKYTPEMTLLVGNHENRINRAINMDSKLDGTISLDDLQYEEFGWTVEPFLKLVDIEGIFMVHYATAGLLDKPVAGVNIARTALNKVHDNIAFGHSHLWDYASTSLPNGRKIVAVNVGCYFEHKEEYVSERAQNEWTRGITILHIESREVKDISFTSLETLKRRYR